jgi:hypothetical protein
MRKLPASEARSQGAECFRVALWELWGRIRVALGWLWGAYQLAINTLCGGFDVALMCLWVAFRGLSPPFLLSTFCFVLFPECGFGWLCPGFQGSRFRVQGSRFGVCHKLPKYSPRRPPPSAWTGGGLVPPWTYPGTIDPAPASLFDQARLSNAVPSGVSALSLYSALDVGCWMFEVRCSGSTFASGAPHPANMRDFHAFAACSLVECPLNS